jgi:hypothetical protein
MDPECSKAISRSGPCTGKCGSERESIRLAEWVEFLLDPEPEKNEFGSKTPQYKIKIPLLVSTGILYMYRVHVPSSIWLGTGAHLSIMSNDTFVK